MEDGKNDVSSALFIKLYISYMKSTFILIILKISYAKLGGGVVGKEGGIGLESLYLNFPLCELAL